jgi:hypothetical protein
MTSGAARTTTGTAGTAASLSAAQRSSLVLLLIDAVLLALLELFFLPLRLDGRVLPALGDTAAPVTVLLAVATTPWLVRQAARTVRPSLAFMPLLAWVVALLLFGFYEPGQYGAIVLVADWRGLLLLAGGALPAAVVLGRALGRGPAGGG